MASLPEGKKYYQQERLTTIALEISITSCKAAYRSIKNETKTCNYIDLQMCACLPSPGGRELCT